MSVSISIIIPVKSGAATIERCLQSILRQTVFSSCEIIVIDSGSQDRTLKILSRFPVRLLEIPAHEFNHGETRNLGAREARGEFVVMTVQDAYASDERWIERMLRHFSEPEVIGVCGQQIVPHDLDKNPLEWFRPYEEPVPRKVRFSQICDFERLTLEERSMARGWDNVTAMYRRSVLLEIPFQKVGFMEDSIWAMDALLKGHALVYDYGARVYHYHHETFRFRFRRRFTILYHIRRHFGTVPLPASIMPQLARISYLVCRRKYCPSGQIKWLNYNIQLALASWLAGWLFWFQVKLGGSALVDRMHTWLCSTAPQPIRTL